MIHITVAVARFFEIILWQIASAGAQILGAILLVVVAIGGIRMLVQRRRR